MKTFRAYRVDPQLRTVEQIAFQDHRTAYAQVGTENLDHAAMRRGDDGLLCFWVDGAGYYKPGLSWWRFAGYEHPLAGVGVICGADQRGETDDVPATLQEVAALVTWIDGRPVLPHATAEGPDGLIADIDFNAPDAPTSMEETYRRLFGQEPPRKP
jgi:hypothetical protein